MFAVPARPSVPQSAPGSVRLLAWLARVVFAMVVMGGVLATAGATPVIGEAEGGDLVEESEDSETVEEASLHARATRQASAGSGAHRRERALHVPRSLAPSVAAPTPPSWHRPRRAPPPDEDDARA